MNLQNLIKLHLLTLVESSKCEIPWRRRRRRKPRRP